MRTRRTVRQSTYETYEFMTYPHIVPALGRVKRKALTPVHVRNFYREKLDGGLSSATVRKMHGVLQKALDQAVSDGLIPRNAAKGIKLPQGKKKEIRPLSPDEARALLDAARGDRLEALYVLAISTGLREGELLALRWEDVDLEGAVLRVSQTLTRDGGKVSVGPPKTKNSQSERWPHGRRRRSPQRSPGTAARRDGALGLPLPPRWPRVRQRTRRHRQPLEPPQPIPQSPAQARRPSVDSLLRP